MSGDLRPDRASQERVEHRDWVRHAFVTPNGVELASVQFRYYRRAGSAGGIARHGEQVWPELSGDRGFLELEVAGAVRMGNSSRACTLRDGRYRMEVVGNVFEECSLWVNSLRRSGEIDQEGFKDGLMAARVDSPHADPTKPVVVRVAGMRDEHATVELVDGKRSILQVPIASVEAMRLHEEISPLVCDVLSRSRSVRLLSVDPQFVEQRSPTGSSALGVVGNRRVIHDVTCEGFNRTELINALFEGIAEGEAIALDEWRPRIGFMCSYQDEHVAVLMCGRRVEIHSWNPPRVRGTFISERGRRRVEGVCRLEGIHVPEEKK